MNWDDVLLELEAAPRTTWASFDLATFREADPNVYEGVRAIERETGARTLADLVGAGEIANVLHCALPRQERRTFFKAMSSAVRKIARDAPAMEESKKKHTKLVQWDAEDVPRGGRALEQWAARFGVELALNQPVRVVTGPRDRSGTVFRLRDLVDIELFPDTGKVQKFDREALRATGLGVLREAVKKQAPLVEARAAFLARRRKLADAWLATRLECLAAAVQRLPESATQAVPSLERQYPTVATRFESRPPSLFIRMGHVEHVVSLSDGAVTNLGSHWHGTSERDELTAAILGCAIDALSDPEGAALKELLAWRTVPAHEHLVADFRLGLARGVTENAPEEAERERVAFRILGNVDDPPQVVLQRPKKGSGFTVGRKVSTADALRTSGLTPLDREILEMSALIESGRFHIPGDAYRAKARLFELLSEHPRVHLDDADKTPVRVRRARARLRITSGPEGFRIELVVGEIVPPLSLLNPDKLTRSRSVVVTDARGATVHFAELDDATIALLQALKANPDPLSSEGLDMLLDAMTSCPELIAELELPEEVRGAPVPADVRLVAQLLLSNDGTLGLAVRVRPLAGAPALGPGLPPRHAYGAVDGKRVFATRDLDDEEERAERLLAELPLAGVERRGGFEVRTDDIQRACDIVAALAELAHAAPDAMAIEWAEGTRLRVARTLGRKSLRLRIDRKRDWFGLRGGVEIDGEQIAIGALLEATRAGRRFVRLGSGDLVAIDRELRARLARASDLLHETKDGIVAPPPALSAITELVESEDDQLVAAKEWLELRARVRSAQASEPDLPAGLQAELRPYQLDGYRWLMRLAACGAGGCLADDMGLGKTVQSLAALVARHELGPALVVAPTSVSPNWLSEASRFAPGLRCVAYRGPDRCDALGELGPGTVLVTSYDILLRDIEQLAPITFATAFFDEAHALKNAQSKRAIAVRRIQADVRFALTGTPIENHTGELWSLFRIVVPGLFGSWERFRDRFAAPIERDRDATRQAALASVVRPYLLRRTKAEVAPELPPRTEIVHFVELSPAERDLYEAERLRAIEFTRAAAAKDAGPEGRFALLAALTRLRQLACHPRLRDPASSVASAKLKSVLALIDELKEAGHRALVFSQFTGHLEIVGEALAARGVAFFELTGSTPAEDRADRVRRFQSGEADVFLISLKAGGTGLNLTAADYVVHLDPWWNPAAEDQASDRAHRIGQDKPVTVVRVIARGTIEENVLELHGEKRELAESVLSGGDVAARLSTSELFALMEKSADEESSQEEDVVDDDSA